MKIGRTEGGVVELWADDLVELQRALGYAHAQDRLGQMCIMRLLGEGRISEVIHDSEETFGADLLARKMQFSREDPTPLDELARTYCDAYCEGVNAYISQHNLPFPLRLMRGIPRTWDFKAIQALMGVHLYFGMGQMQERVERFIYTALHDGVPLEKMQQLFPALEGMRPEYIALLREVKLERPYLDKAFTLSPTMSNNWALSGKHTTSGAPYLCFDPHLQVNRLPAMWAEIVCHIPEQECVGVTLPGFPGVIMGRTHDLAASFTYGMMDVVDFFIEDCRSGPGDFSVRQEVIRRKKKGEVSITFYETKDRVLERADPTVRLIEPGLYLSLAWSVSSKNKALNALSKLWQCKTVMEAQEIACEIPMSCNWVMADREGNIGYQQSGEGPKRSKHSGLYPVPSWEEGSLWEGRIAPHSLKRILNPEEGYCATANNDQGDGTSTIPFETYRIRRIRERLSEKKTFDLEEMKGILSDLYSSQAALFMEKITPLLPQTPVADVLRQWDLCYSLDSQGAPLFEALYEALFASVFGPLFGQEAWQEVTHHHTLLVYSHGQFDLYLLKHWDQNHFKRVIEKTLSLFTVHALPRWGEQREFLMKNLFFNGRLPKWLKFDIGPIALAGNRATIPSVHVIRETNRPVVAATSYRFISDLSSDEVFTVLAGGPSERRFSSSYASDIEKWIDFEYKTLSLASCKSPVLSSSSSASSS